MVVNGDYEAAEHLLRNAVDKGLFGPYIHQQDYVPQWLRILPCIDEDPCQRPGMRVAIKCVWMSTPKRYISLAVGMECKI